MILIIIFDEESQQQVEEIATNSLKFKQLWAM
jgi:hypothetical protein